MTGLELKTMLIDLKWSQAELARRLKTAPNTIGRWVNGRTPIPRAVSLWLNLLHSIRNLTR